MKRKIMSLGLFICALGLCFNVVSASAATVKIGVVDIQKVLATSTVGKKAQQELEKKMTELQAALKKDEEELFALQREIEKRSSVWSDEMRREKAVAFQKKRRELAGAQEDARFELQQLEQHLLEPLLEKMRTVLEDHGKRGAYTIILPQTAALYFDDKIDLTDLIARDLDKSKK